MLFVHLEEKRKKDDSNVATSVDYIVASIFKFNQPYMQCWYENYIYKSISVTHKQFHISVVQVWY